MNVQMTVWGLNYATIADSARQLPDLGVRGLSFHSGTLEGSADPDGDRLVPVDPAAWRALAGQLLRIRDANAGRLESFLVPWLYFTEDEIRDHVIGDETTAGAYLEHVARTEAGEPSVKPVQACPALDVPQVYLYGNGGPDWRGSLSALQPTSRPARKRSRSTTRTAAGSRSSNSVPAARPFSRAALPASL